MSFISMIEKININFFKNKESKRELVKPRLYLERGLSANKRVAFNVFAAPFKSYSIDKYGDILFEYYNDLKNISLNEIPFHFNIKNTGDIQIKTLYLASTYQKRMMIFDYNQEGINSLCFAAKLYSYSVLCNYEMAPNETFNFSVYFNRKHDYLYKSYSSLLSIYAIDEFGNCWEYPIFLLTESMEGPYLKKRKYIRGEINGNYTIESLIEIAQINRIRGEK